MGVSVHYLCKSRPKSWITVAAGSGLRATGGPGMDPAAIGDKMTPRLEPAIRRNL